MSHRVQPCFIMSASLEYRDPPLNVLMSRQLRDQLARDGIPHKWVEGVYKGSHENSYLILDGDGRKEYVAELCRRYEQECYLYRDGQGLAWFVYADGREELQGAFVSRDKETAKRQDGYTY